jgi:N-acetylmuramoyl-L-alanine amidase
MRLAVVVGHTKESPGAYSAQPLRLSEYDYNTQVAQEMYRYAMEKGLQTKIFTRDSGGLTKAYKEINEYCKDDGVVIELHLNAFNGKAKGTETLFDMEPTESIDFAREIHEVMLAVFNRKGKEDRGIKKRLPGDRGYLNLALCKAPSCIVEPAFCDNRDEAQILMERQKDYAASLVDGVFNYYASRDMKMALN